MRSRTDGHRGRDGVRIRNPLGNIASQRGQCWGRRIDGQEVTQWVSHEMPNENVWAARLRHAGRGQRLNQEVGPDTLGWGWRGRGVIFHGGCLVGLYCHFKQACQ